MKKRDIYATIGASNHSKQTRAELDYYATPPAAVDALLNKEQFNNKIWECCCGGGAYFRSLKTSRLRSKKHRPNKPRLYRPGRRKRLFIFSRTYRSRHYN